MFVPFVSQDLRLNRDACVIAERIEGQSAVRAPWGNQVIAGVCLLLFAFVYVAYQVIGKTAAPLASIRLAAASLASSAKEERAMSVEAVRVQVVLDSAKHSHPRYFSCCWLVTLSALLLVFPQAGCGYESMG